MSNNNDSTYDFNQSNLINSESTKSDNIVNNLINDNSSSIDSLFLDKSDVKEYINSNIDSVSSKLDDTDSILTDSLNSKNLSGGNNKKISSIRYLNVNGNGSETLSTITESEFLPKKVKNTKSGKQKVSSKSKMAELLGADMNEINSMKIIFG